MNSDGSEKTARDLAKGGGIILLGSFAGLAMEYGMRVMVARNLGVSQYGLLAIGTSVLMIAGTFGLLGLQSGLSRFISFYRGRNETGKVKGTLTGGLMITVPVSILFGIVTFVSAEKLSVWFFNEPEMIPVIRILSAGVPLLSVFFFLLAVLRGFKNMGYFTAARDFSEKGSRLVLTAAVLIAGFGLLGVCWVYPAALIVSIITGMFLLRRIVRKEKDWDASDHVSVKKDLVVFSLPLMGVRMLGIFRHRIDTIIIGFFMTSYYTGLYNAAMPIARALQMVLSSLNGIFMPSISELYAQNNIQELRSVYRRTAKWTFCLTLPAYLFILTFSRQIIMAMFGSEYKDAWIPLVILATGIFINTSSGSFGDTFIAVGKTGVNLLIVVFLVSINIILNIILIPLWGIAGASMANAVSLIIVCIIGFLYLYKVLKLQPFSVYHVKILLSGSIALGAGWLFYYLMSDFFNGDILFVFLSFFLIYILHFILLYVFGGMDEIEQNMIKNIIAKFTAGK